jgi:hypothetical protein
MNPYELQFFLLFNFFVLKNIFFESFRWGIIPLDFAQVFLLGLSNFKMTSIILNTGFHIDLGKFVVD